MNTRIENPVSTDAVRKRRIEPLSVEVTTDFAIRLVQDDYGDGGNTILLSPDQVDVVVQLLGEAKHEAMKAREREGNSC